MWTLLFLALTSPSVGQGMDLEFAQAEVGSSATETELIAWMDGLLSDPAGYRAQVRREAHSFPEGSLFPYVFPAMSWTNLAIRDPALRGDAREKIDILLKEIIPAVTLATSPPDGDLTKLGDYRSQAVMLGQLNLVLGCWKLVGGDDRHAALHRRISGILAEALRTRNGQPLDSYPMLVWPFDTIPVIVSLHMADAEQYADLIDRHLAWIEEHGLEPTTGLPYSRLDHRDLKPTVGPRGCDISYRIALLAQLDRRLATDLYERYTRSFWIRRTLATGFAEWPDGRSDIADIDSGPVIMGLGTAATGLGIAATRAADDAVRWRTLESELLLVTGVLKTFAPTVRKHPSFKAIPLNVDDYKTGFMFGDVCLLWATTWVDWGVGRSQGSQAMAPSSPKATR